MNNVNTEVNTKRMDNIISDEQLKVNKYKEKQQAKQKWLEKAVEQGKLPLGYPGTNDALKPL